MKVLRIQGEKGQASLVMDSAPEPVPGASELRVRVRAAGLNRADLLQIRGAYPAPPDVPPDVPGLEFSGEVLEVGPRVRRFRPGDRVMGLVGGGAFSEQLVLHEREALHAPEHLSFPEAAALPEAYLTAFDALVLQGGLQAGEAVLVTAVASGVGSAAALLCRAAGAQVLGTGRSEAKLARAKDWGVSHALHVPGSPPRYAEAVREATGGRGVDLALELVGGDYLPETLSALAPRGRALLVGLVAGRSATLDLGLVLSRRLRLTGTVLRSRPPEEKMALVQAAERQLLPLFRSGALPPVVDAVLPFTRAAEALERMQGNAPVGKLVLAWEA
ncbi:NAD(P)H-quinone oxidoreductase [Aggregicoccus sp. 17bor-14]|uniref:NAD(P)H-quinone oxidoreductase n=1 Tax=Myxococcaceae TaxID=31 RepID=UPI00129CDF88|nr:MULTISPECIES: NAD(P)H-quinone oxidoreductase [Myxococcaceae]MBF5044213.1 NAD(P)H-quinone oxidoreductase [Simulacricoccus sp. 17bor-14]MRI89963.1 NAD(P)H-quinone oxidoreductase [Aggregicoccus sp. 17bor-14]